MNTSHIHAAGRSLLLLILLLAMPNAGSAQKRVRFAQLTDIHLSERTPSHKDDLERSVRRINALDSLDFVLVTGDVSENGDRASLLEAKKTLDGLKVPYYAVMGNHETKWSASGCTAWSEVFGSERFETDCKGVHFIGFNTGPLMRMAFGHVVKQDLLWLRERLGALSPDVPVVVVTHYPLLSEEMDNWHEATDLLRHFNVRLCIGGHYHISCNYSYDGIPGVLMSSCCHDDAHATAYGLYEADADSITAWMCEDGKEPQRIAAYSMRGEIKDKDGRVLAPDGRAFEYPDTADNATYPGVRRVWVRESEASVYSSPAVDSKKIYVADDAGKITACSLKDGKPRWTFATGGRIVGTPAVYGGTVVAGSADGCIYGVSAKSGKLKWKVRTGAPVLGAVRIEDGVAYVGGSDSCMRALRVKDGAEVWKYEGVDGYIETMPLVTEDRVLFGAWDCTFYCLSRRDGSLLWRWKVDKEDMHYSPAAVWPVAADGKVFIADPERALTAIDLQSGRTVWRTQQSMVRETVALSEDKEKIYSKTMRDSLVCYSTAGDTPRELWSCCVGFGYDHAPSMPQEKEGVVYGGTVRGLVYAVDAQTGRLLWRHRVGSSLVNTVVPLARRRVLYTSSDGGVGLLEW